MGIWYNRDTRNSGLNDYTPVENCNNGGFKQCLMDWTDLNDWKELQSKVWASYPQLWRFPATVQFNQFSYCWFTGLLLYFKLWFLNVFRWYSDFITFFFQKMMNSKMACSQCHHIQNGSQLVDMMAFLGSSGHIWRFWEHGTETHT